MERLPRIDGQTRGLYMPHLCTKTSLTKVNDLKYDLLCAQKGDIESHPLSPCRYCLEKHALRANYQTAI